MVRRNKTWPLRGSARLAVELNLLPVHQFLIGTNSGVESAFKNHFCSILCDTVVGEVREGGKMDVGEVREGGGKMDVGEVREGGGKMDVGEVREGGGKMDGL